MIGVRSARETFSRPASLEDLLGSFVQAAVPAVQQLLGPPARRPAACGRCRSAGRPAPRDRSDCGQRRTGGAARRDPADLCSARSPAVPGASLPPPRFGQNRLTAGYARPFLFGVDDALHRRPGGAGRCPASRAPSSRPFLELLNAANQHRLDSRREDYRMIETCLGGLDRTKLIERLTAAGAMRRLPASRHLGSRVAELLALLRTAEAPAQQGPAPAPPSATSRPPAPPPHSRLRPPGSIPRSAPPMANRPGCLDPRSSQLTAR